MLVCIFVLGNCVLDLKKWNKFLSKLTIGQPFDNWGSIVHQNVGIYEFYTDKTIDIIA